MVHVLKPGGYIPLADIDHHQEYTAAFTEFGLRDKYGVKHSCLYLIRPDWYIGFRGRLKDSDKLMAYLDRNLIAKADS